MLLYKIFIVAFLKQILPGKFLKNIKGNFKNILEELIYL